MLDPAQLAALTAIHRRGSFDLAAASLSVTPSAISQRLKALEERFGHALIRRGQPCEATEIGLRLIRHHEQITLLEGALTREILPASALLTPDWPTLRLAVNADSLATWLLPALATTDGLLFDLVIDDQDHSQHLLRGGEVAAAVTGHPGPLQGCETIPLGAMRYRATASPAYMARHLPKGAERSTLMRAPALTFSDKDRLQRDWLLRETGSRFSYPIHRIASSTGFVEAALLGIGWGMNPDLLVAGHLASGRLVEVIPHSALDVPLYWQYPRLMADTLTPVTNRIQAAARDCLIPISK
jgi:LysR family transcriptional regulator, chromosome initiation inhibitor